VPLLDIEDLHVSFHTREGVVRAVDGVSFTAEKGETVGIVGESGCGKTVTALSILGLVPSPPGKVTGSRLSLGGTDLLRVSAKDLRAIRGKRVSMIFQDPMTALNPYMRVGKQIIEPLVLHEHVPKPEARKRAIAMLESVGIQDAERRMEAFPHELSGGMRQRVMIAMALITKPELVIADEPTTALDVTVQAQILAVIKRMQNEIGMAVALITHDLGIVAGVCDRVLVMYAGKIVESSSTRPLFYETKHPYSSALIEALPATRAKGERLLAIPGLPPDLSRPIIGCSFAPRCKHVVDRCRRDNPALCGVAHDHLSACLRVQNGEL
jgi:oligopeptide transport system ATP-binding protein